MSSKIHQPQYNTLKAPMNSSGDAWQERTGRGTQRVNHSLWDDKSTRRPGDSFNPLPTTISGSLTQEQISAYQTMYRIQEITVELRSNDLKLPQRRSRSASPPPAYDSRGKRINTREQRYRRKLEEERHRLVEIVLKMVPHFVAPEDYKRPVKFQDKYYIPVEQYPGINFVGLLLGPRGNTLKKLQEDSGCKIAIRGRGSVKEGKNAHDLPKGAMNFSDPLHCLIIADSEEKIQKGIKVCENIVVKAVTSPEGQNDLKRGQLRELAELNGTLREDNRPCNTCGLQGHKNYECPNTENINHRVLCRNCGRYGHLTSDCIESSSSLPQVRHDTRFSRYAATTGPNWQSQSGDRLRQVSYNNFERGKSADISSSYKPRFSRERSGPSFDSRAQNDIDYGISHSGQTYQEQAKTPSTDSPPPGFNPDMVQPADWNVPGMSLAYQNMSNEHENPTIGAVPPGMNLSSTGIPGMVDSSGAQPLGGPPGLVGSSNESLLKDSPQGPPGL